MCAWQKCWWKLMCNEGWAEEKKHLSNTSFSHTFISVAQVKSCRIYYTVAYTLSTYYCIQTADNCTTLKIINETLPMAVWINQKVFRSRHFTLKNMCWWQPHLEIYHREWILPGPFICASQWLWTDWSVSRKQIQAWAEPLSLATPSEIHQEG